MNRYWLVLLLAGCCEIGWVSGMKHATSVGEWTLTVLGIFISFFGLLYVSQALPVGTTYAVFTGIGAAGAVLAEAVFFNITLDAGKLALVIVLIIGIVGLKMTTATGVQEVEE
ncbi:multidrug efflux SMR transporter [Cohnella sp. WQ 127256]|uniref:DMT family transporter n=1 Tax=Cohnella sp. WQ 127256 TaxID=2938790 RepID=UPI002117D3B7|nr:multidrug efflux SMR transporter [Cohnella sp. WQ 127256]